MPRKSRPVPELSEQTARALRAVLVRQDVLIPLTPKEVSDCDRRESGMVREDPVPPPLGPLLAAWRRRRRY